MSLFKMYSDKNGKNMENVKKRQEENLLLIVNKSQISNKPNNILKLMLIYTYLVRK